MNRIEVKIRGTKSHILEGDFIDGVLVAIFLDGKIVEHWEVPERNIGETEEEKTLRISRGKQETQRQHYIKILLNEWKIVAKSY
jgi:hypothetical protein